MFSFSSEGFECIVNLTEIDQAYLLAKMGGDTTGVQNVNNILSMTKLRAEFNQQQRMEVWLLKIDNDDVTEEDLVAWAERDPQAVADLARKGEPLYAARRHAYRPKVIE